MKKNNFSDQERVQSNFWDKKSVKETFEFLSWPGVIERDCYLSFAGIKGKPKILEIGAGTGRWTIPLLEKGFEVTATDISGNSLRILKTKAIKLHLEKNLTVVKNDFEKPIYKEYFDAVFCFGVIHHLDPKKRNIIVRNVVKALKKDGNIFLLEPNPLNPLYYLSYFCRWLFNMRDVNRWSIEKGFLRSSIWELKEIFQDLGIGAFENRWYGYLPSRFAIHLPFVLKFNLMMNKIYFLRLFSAYIWLKGKKVW